MSKDMIPQDILESKILLIRGHKVMLDRDLAALYAVETKVLKRAVNRNASCFPPDFMSTLSESEMKNLRCQFGTSSWGGQRYAAYAFTENGVAMLSSVLNSERAIEVNIQIMRTFTRLRGLLASHRDLARRLDDLEHRYDAQFKNVFDAIKALMAEPEGPEPKRIRGFKP